MTHEPDDLRPLDFPRRLHAQERELIEQLLQQPFVGPDEIRSQLATVHVAAEVDRDTRTLRFVQPHAPDAPRAPTVLRLPVEAESTDTDGTPIAVLLHVIDGWVEELEIYRVDGQPIARDEPWSLESISVNHVHDLEPHPA